MYDLNTCTEIKSVTEKSRIRSGLDPKVSVEQVFLWPILYFNKKEYWFYILIWWKKPSSTMSESFIRVGRVDGAFKRWYQYSVVAVIVLILICFYLVFINVMQKKKKSLRSPGRFLHTSKNTLFVVGCHYRASLYAHFFHLLSNASSFLYKCYNNNSYSANVCEVSSRGWWIHLWNTDYVF